MRTLGMRRNPLSSRNTRWAPSLRVFFYTWPLVFLPVGDGFLVSLRGPAFRLLPRPFQTHHHAPHMARVVANPEMLLDQLGNPRQSPEVCCVSCRWSASLQQSQQLALLRLGQSRRTSRRWLRPECGRPTLSEALHPTHHRAYRGIQSRGNRLIRLAGSQQSYGSTSACFQLLRGSMGSHAP